jgi:hypothetical protein
VIDQQTLLFLIDEAGLSVGIGEWRCEKCGEFGAFRSGNPADEKAWPLDFLGADLCRNLNNPPTVFIKPRPRKTAWLLGFHGVMKMSIIDDEDDDAFDDFAKRKASNELAEPDYCFASNLFVRKALDADAKAIGAKCEAVVKETGGFLSPEDLEARARDNPASPFHKHLEWDDTIAGHKFRIMQIKAIIRALRVLPRDTIATDEPVRAFFSVLGKKSDKAIPPV